MTKSAFAAHAQIRNVVLCSLLTVGLAACGAEGASSGSDTASASDSIPSLVAPNVGFIDRTSDTATGSNATSASASGSVASTASPGSASGASASGTAATSGSTGSSTSSGTSSSGTSTSGTTTVASSTKTTTKPSSGAATLDWTPPTENSDGSVLTNLAGYTVYYGTSPSSLTQSVKVTNPGLATYTMQNLPAGTWYFAVTSYSSAGVESARSGVVSTTI